MSSALDLSALTERARELEAQLEKKDQQHKKDMEVIGLHEKEIERINSKLKKEQTLHQQTKDGRTALVTKHIKKVEEMEKQSSTKDAIIKDLKAKNKDLVKENALLQSRDYRDFLPTASPPYTPNSPNATVMSFADIPSDPNASAISAADIAATSEYTASSPEFSPNGPCGNCRSSEHGSPECTEGCERCGSYNHMGIGRCNAGYHGVKRELEGDDSIAGNGYRKKSRIMRASV
ncbi:uncharacterized protein PAC_17240 [Phialocephala subalpina]|uniref:Uncharacterized protein n=1 Tax=Phialocephala subalpina TaxID=576137 RepID=A0A1L7XQL0_9HELO|nr:uncharacterized protein PAC_17240 [Phialocephala subalpina]